MESQQNARESVTGEVTFVHKFHCSGCSGSIRTLFRVITLSYAVTKTVVLSVTCIGIYVLN